MLKTHINVGIRSKQYKYLYFPQYDYEMLFNLEQDPNENNNLALDDNYQAITQKYRQLLERSQQELA